MKTGFSGCFVGDTHGEGVWCTFCQQLPLGDTPHSFARTDTNLSVRKKRRQETMMGEDGPNNPGMELKLEWLEQVGLVSKGCVRGRGKC